MAQLRASTQPGVEHARGGWHRLSGSLGSRRGGDSGSDDRLGVRQSDAGMDRCNGA
jgi:hypothetical protein